MFSLFRVILALAVIALISAALFSYPDPHTRVLGESSAGASYSSRQSVHLERRTEAVSVQSSDQDRPLGSSSDDPLRTEHGTSAANSRPSTAHSDRPRSQRLGGALQQRAVEDGERSRESAMSPAFLSPFHPGDPEDAASSAAVEGFTGSRRKDYGKTPQIPISFFIPEGNLPAGSLAEEAVFQAQTRFVREINSLPNPDPSAPLYAEQWERSSLAHDDNLRLWLGAQAYFQLTARTLAAQEAARVAAN